MKQSAGDLVAAFERDHIFVKEDEIPEDWRNEPAIADMLTIAIVEEGAAGARKPPKKKTARATEMKAEEAARQKRQRK